MPQCVAYGCTNLSGKTTAGKKTFHLFPKNPQRRKAWVQSLRREGFEATKTTVICSDHFQDSHFDRTGQTTRLRENAVPTIFNFPKHFPKETSVSNTSKNRKILRCKTTTGLSDSEKPPCETSRIAPSSPQKPASETSSRNPANQQKAAGNAPSGVAVGQREEVTTDADHSYIMTPLELKKKLDAAHSAIEIYKKKLKIALQHNRRLQKRVHTLKVRTLKEVVRKINVKKAKMLAAAGKSETQREGCGFQAQTGQELFPTFS